MGSSASATKATIVDSSSTTGKEHHHTMPFFRRQSAEAKKKLQHQLYLARESPEATFDISGCEISEVPSGVFSLCKVLQKEALLLHYNWMASFKGGGDLKDLACLRVLDLHENELTALPDDIHLLRFLQILNVENNRLKHLPSSIGKLENLQTLNVRGNKLKNIDSSLCSMKSLRTIDITKNHVNYLPKELCHVRTLENLILDSPQMQYPQPEVCSQGTEAIMKFLCSDCDMEYLPASKFLLDVLDAPRSMSISSSNHSVNAELVALSASVMHYDSMKEKKRLDSLALEKQLEEDQRLQAQLAAKAATDKQHLISYMAQDQERLQGELEELQHKKEEERHKLVDALYSAERNAHELVNQLLAMNEKAKKTEALWEKLEKERIETEQLFIVRQEEEESLRKKEVLIAMEMILAESRAFEEVFHKYTEERFEAVRAATVNASCVDNQLETVLHDKDIEHSNLIGGLLREEQLQKEAFEALQLQKDAKHQRITGQITLIEQQLAQLTILEVEQGQLRMDTQMDVLEQKRKALAQLLMQLITERNHRESELKKRLHEMEQTKLDDQTDYWLVQYQRLMDRKPQSLIDQEKQLEFAVVEILEAAGAHDYISLFARHRISIETLYQLTEEDMKQMGIHELGLRKSILREIIKAKSREEEEAAAEKLKFEKPSAPTEQESWTLPPREGEHVGQVPSAPPKESPEIIARGLNTECVICMNDQSSILFLNCGHVCCCIKCSEPITECPLCRGTIVQRVRF